MKLRFGDFIEHAVIFGVIAMFILTVNINSVVASSNVEIKPNIWSAAYGDAEFIPPSIYVGDYSIAHTLVRIYPVVFTVGKYRVELSGFEMYAPKNIDGNVPGRFSINWKNGLGRYFSGRVWYWESHEISTGFNTFWLDYKTGSPYPQTAITKVGFYGVLGFNIYDNPGTAKLDILPLPGGPR